MTSKEASGGIDRELASEQSQRNVANWAGSSSRLARVYSTDALRPPEAAILDRYGDAMSRRVLELGCGSGRITGHLSALADEVHGIDIAPAMVELCRRDCPEATIGVGDLRDLSAYEDGSFDAIFAGFNVVDVLDHDERLAMFAELHRILSRRGLLVFSSHNRASAPQMRTAWHVRRSPLRGAKDVLLLPLRVRNRTRVRRFERESPDHAVLNDGANQFALVHYYIAGDDQERQLAANGFGLLECLDMEGHTVAPGENAPTSSELHYVATRSD